MHKSSKKFRHAQLVICLSVVFSGSAVAGIPVTDIINDASNIIQNVQLKKLTKALTQQKPGTINNYTKNIDAQTNNIALNAVNIDNSTTKIDESTHNIDNSTKNIDVITTNNFVIDADFTWNITHNGGEIIPIPDPIKDGIEEIKNHFTTDAYIANFKSAEFYRDSGGANKDHLTSGIEGSRARKAANDMLVKSLDAQMEGLNDEADQVTKIAERIVKSQGHGNQLQMANVLAGTQVDQTMKLRSMLLASESARAAEAHAAADRDARAIATSKQLREGLADAIRKGAPKAPKY